MRGSKIVSLTISLPIAGEEDTPPSLCLTLSYPHLPSLSLSLSLSFSLYPLTPHTLSRYASISLPLIRWILLNISSQFRFLAFTPLPRVNARVPALPPALCCFFFYFLSYSRQDLSFCEFSNQRFGRFDAKWLRRQGRRSLTKPKERRRKRKRKVWIQCEFLL